MGDLAQFAQLVDGMSPEVTVILKCKVIANGLNIRQSPASTAPVLGNRASGDIINAVSLDGKDIWVQDERGWSAVQISGVKFMEIE
jgi:hypothetical protein